MTPERIAELLADSNQIKEEPLESFERLIIAYPYSQSMQLLYGMKLKSLGKAELSKDSSWQVYFPDKNHLYYKIHGEKDLSFQNEVDRIDLEIEEIFSELEYGDKIKPTINEEAELMDEDSIFDTEQFKVKEELKENQESNPIEEDSILSVDRIIEENDYSKDIKFIDIKKSKKKKLKKIVSKNLKPKKKKSPKKVSLKKEEVEKVQSKTKQEAIKPKTIVTKTKKKKKAKKKQVVLKKLIPALPEISTDSSEDPFVQWLASLKKKEKSIMASKDKKKKTKKEKKKKDLEVVQKKPKSKKGKKFKTPKSKKSKAKKGRKEKKASKKQAKLQRKIDSSLNRRKEVASPTLADLLAKQGHNKEAIKIYKQLMLNNPEKNSYFASQIKKLK